MNSMWPRRTSQVSEDSLEFSGVPRVGQAGRRPATGSFARPPAIFAWPLEKNKDLINIVQRFVFWFSSISNSSQMTKKKKCDSSSTSSELLVTQAV